MRDFQLRQIEALRDRLARTVAGADELAKLPCVDAVALVEILTAILQFPPTFEAETVEQKRRGKLAMKHNAIVLDCIAFGWMRGETIAPEVDDASPLPVRENGAGSREAP